jgi:hypothetical protein
MRNTLGATALGIGMLVGSLGAAEPPQAEPPQTGYKVDKLVVPLLPEYRVTGPSAGQTLSLLCTYANRPVVIVYTREMNEPLIGLIKKIDEATAAHSKHPAANYQDNLASYVVLVCDSKDREAELKALAEKEKIKHTVLALVVINESTLADQAKHNWTTLRDFQAKLGTEAESTVLLAQRGKAQAIYAYRKSELNDKEMDQILGDLPKILPKKD